MQIESNEKHRDWTAMFIVVRCDDERRYAHLTREESFTTRERPSQGQWKGDIDRWWWYDRTRKQISLEPKWRRDKTKKRKSKVWCPFFIRSAEIIVLSLWHFSLCPVHSTEIRSAHFISLTRPAAVACSLANWSEHWHERIKPVCHR